MPTIPPAAPPASSKPASQPRKPEESWPPLIKRAFDRAIAESIEPLAVLPDPVAPKTADVFTANPSDPIQGQVGDSNFIAAMVALVAADPKALLGRVSQRGSVPGEYTVRFHDPATQKPIDVHVSVEPSVIKNGVWNFIPGITTEAEGDKLAAIERAIAHLAGDWSKLDATPSTRAIGMLSGATPTVLKISPSTKILALLRTAADKNQVVVAASRSGHAMNITTTRDGKGIIAANPWASGSEKPEPMTEAHFAREFAEVTFIDRP